MEEYCMQSHSPIFQKTLEYCRKVADSDANILLVGESGTGKEVAAKYIHHRSRRKSKDFVAVNCSAFTDSLLESELFGYERGAFTGAEKGKIGKIELSHQGSLFLDEIGETSISTQIKLLRVLETKRVEPVGSNESRLIDFRLISATNADLDEAIANHVFREDFFYRVSTVVIRIPPLRQRREDLNMLIDFFLRRAERENDKKIVGILPEVEDFLYQYHYPGNVRELKNIIDRMVILSEKGWINKDCLPVMHSLGMKEETKNKILLHKEDILPLREHRRRSEREYLIQVLKLCDDNVAESARHLQISARQLFNKIRDYDIRR